MPVLCRTEIEEALRDNYRSRSVDGGCICPDPGDAFGIFDKGRATNHDGDRGVARLHADASNGGGKVIELDA